MAHSNSSHYYQLLIFASIPFQSYQSSQTTLQLSYSSDLSPPGQGTCPRKGWGPPWWQLGTCGPSDAHGTCYSPSPAHGPLLQVPVCVRDQLPGDTKGQQISSSTTCSACPLQHQKAPEGGLPPALSVTPGQCSTVKSLAHCHRWHLRCLPPCDR